MTGVSERDQANGSRPNARARLDHLAADRAEPGDADALPVEASRLRVLRLLPAAWAQVARRVDDAAVEGEDEAHRELGDGDRVFPGTLRDVDAARARGGDVDGVHPCPCADDEVELAAGFDGARRDLGRADDEDADALEGVGQRVLGKLRAGDDLDTQDAELIERLGVHLVGEQEAHAERYVSRNERALLRRRTCPRRVSFLGWGRTLLLRTAELSQPTTNPRPDKPRPVTRRASGPDAG